jgi:uncharacterized protein
MSDETRTASSAKIEIAAIEIAANGLDLEIQASTDELTDLQDLFADFIDRKTGPIGRVVGSEREPAGAHQFFIWASEDARSLDVGHIVATFSEDAVVVGVVDEPRRYSDLQSFLDDYYDRHLEIALDEEPPTRRPEILVFAVNVLATKHRRVDVDSHRPPVAGPVFFATREAIAFALDNEGFTGAAIPALMHTNGNAERNDDGSEQFENGNVVFQRAPICLDEDYLLGPEAGHANWTGQSGLATKTSHALFLTSAVFQTMRREEKSVAALMFNVKGADLLWLDKPADPGSPQLAQAYASAGFAGLRPADLEAYRSLELEPEAFENLRIFAPFKPSQEPRADRSGPAGIVHLESLKDPSKLNTLRSNPPETSRVYPILWPLSDLLFQPHKVFEYGDLDDKFFGFIAEVRDGRQIKSLIQLQALFAEIEHYFEDDPSRTEWQGHHKFTIAKAKNRFNGLTSKFGGLVTDGIVDYGSLPRVDSEFSNQEVRVVDIAHCNSNVQELLVTNIVNQLWKKAEREELGVEKVIIFVDELNKYAPGGGEGALRDTLVDIAARGRHLNVVLFGAQQFRSKVDDEILGNCGTSLYGRIGDEEIVNSAYRSLSETAKKELLGLKKGRLLVRHAHFRAPLFGSFPMPPTVPGQVGGRVFNGGKSAVVIENTAGDGLYAMLKREMKTGCPSKNEVLNEVVGVDAQRIVWITQSVEQRCQQRRGTSAESRITAWAMALDQIRKARQ